MKGSKESIKNAQREADRSRTSTQVARLSGTKKAGWLEVENRTKDMPNKVSKNTKIFGGSY